MANSVSHARLPYPIINARYTLEYVGLDADGDPTDPTTPDTEVSQDGGAFADAAEEVSTITGSNGCGYVTLTGAEMNNSLVMACVKVASGPKATVFSLRPRNLAIVGSGTLSAGSAGGGTLDTLLAYDVTGCFIRTTGGTGGGGTGGANNQARRIITYNTSTGAFTVSPNWETTPSTDTTYDVLLPEGVTLGMLKTLNPATAGRTLVVDAAGLADANMVKLGPSGSGTAQTAKDLGAINVTNLNTLSGHDPGATLASQTNITAGTITTVGTVNSLATDSINSNALAASAVTEMQSGLATSSALAAVQADTDDIQARLPAALTSNGNLKVSLQEILTTALTETSTGYLAAAYKKLFDVASPVLTAASVNQTGDSFARIGATGSGLTSLAPSATALSTAQWTNARAGYLDTLSTGVTLATSQPSVGFTQFTVNSVTLANHFPIGFASITIDPTYGIGVNCIYANGTLFSTAVTSPIAAIAADNPNTPTKNVALSNLVFTMVDATDFNTPETGVTVTAQISKDGGSFANCTNSVSEISGGFYKISLTQTEMNCDAVALKFTGTGCAQRNFSFRTQPT